MFSPHQQCMRYLVEFTLPDKDSTEKTSDSVEGVICESRDGVEEVESEAEPLEEGTFCNIRLLHRYCIYV